MANERFPLPGVAPEVLLGMAARRLYSTAISSGRTKERVPALGLIEPLAQEAASFDDERLQGLTGTLSALTYLFGLDRQGAELLTFGLAMELDERIYHAALNLTGSLIGAPGPRIGGFLALLYPSLLDRTKALEALMDDAPLLRYRLVRVLGDNHVPLSQRELCGEPALIHQVIHGEQKLLPMPLVGVAQIVEPAHGWNPSNNSVSADLAQHINLLSLDEVPFRALHIHPLGRRDAIPLARRIASNQGRPVIILDIRSVEKNVEEMVAVTLRESKLRHGIPLFVNPMSSPDNEEVNDHALEKMAQRWCRMLTLERGLVLFGTDSHESDDLERLERIGLPMADYTLRRGTLQNRRDLFTRALDLEKKNSHGGITDVRVAPDVSIDDLASIYRIDEGEINAIVRHATLTAQLRTMADNKPTVITPADMWNAGRELTKREIGKYASLVRSNYTMDDLVLLDEAKEELMDFFHAARSRARVFEDWGYSKKHLRRQGLCVLFAGESGTGKTMAAEVVANMLNVNMYQFDLSMVVSKWLGETERNLGEIFTATESTDAVLFFDEADALFGKRTEVQDAKDRYANVETSYLLQRIEDYDGIVILSTNFRSNIDKAFLRRLQFGIQFEKPDARCRTMIWSKIFPPEAPLGPDVKFDDLAMRYPDLTGGQIRVVAVGASLLASGTSKSINLEHIQRSFTHEMNKMQHLVYPHVEGQRPVGPHLSLVPDWYE